MLSNNIVSIFDRHSTRPEKVFKEVKLTQREPQIKLNRMLFVLLGCKSMGCTYGTDHALSRNSKAKSKKKMVDKVIQLKSVNEYLLYCHKFSMVNFYDYFIHHSAYLWKNIFMRKN